MSNTLYKKAREYIDFEIAGKQVKIPYVLAKGRRLHFWDSSGKGTYKQIRVETIKRAKDKGVVLNLIPGLDINRFMRREGIGIECSGFVYHLLDAFMKEKKGSSLVKCLLRYSGFLGKLERVLLRPYRVRRISAQDLTSDINTVRIEKVSEIRAADLIRLSPLKWSGKHVAIIVEVTPKCIVYAHSSKDTKKQGPHFGKIEVTVEDAGLEEQQWFEETKYGNNYGESCFKIENGDSVRRLKCLP